MMYTQFAAVYDELMADIPYGHYAELIEAAIGTSEGRKILDVACGTGILSVLLAERGACVTGIDLSKDMLAVAQERAERQSQRIDFRRQAMQKLDIGDRFDAAVIPIDSLNYLESEQDVLDTFKGIHSVLRPGGVLLFDVHSTFKTDVIFQEGPFTYDSSGITYIWETEPGDEPHSVHSELAFFVRDADGRYRRFDEVHYQRTYPVMQYADLLAQAGFAIERIFADWEDEAPEEESERIFFQVRK